MIFSSCRRGFVRLCPGQVVFLQNQVIVCSLFSQVLESEAVSSDLSGIFILFFLNKSFNQCFSGLGRTVKAKSVTTLSG